MSAQRIDVFVSYKREDRDRAEAIARRLKLEGYSVWWDVELLPGEQFRDAILEVIERASSAIVLWSKRSTTSAFVTDEASRARDRGILVPVQLDDCTLPLGFGDIHTLDLSRWRGDPDDRRLKPLVAAVGRLVEESGENLKKEPKAVESLIADEVREWRAIAEAPDQSPEQYKKYLESHGDMALFFKLAVARIEELEQRLTAREEKSRIDFPRILGVGSALVGIVGGVIAALLNWDALMVKLGYKEPLAEPEKFSAASTCSGDWIHKGRGYCDDHARPIFVTVENGEKCGYDENKVLVQPVGFKTCRHLNHGMERYAESQIVQGNSGWVRGGLNQGWWCQRMQNDFQAARPNLQIAWTEVSSGEDRRKRNFHAEYNYFWRATANWNAIYKLTSTDACGTLDPIEETVRKPKRCEDRSQVRNYERSRNLNCAWDERWFVTHAASTRRLLSEFEAELVDRPLCSTCDEWSKNAEQQARCLIMTRDIIAKGPFVLDDSSMRLLGHVQRAANSLLTSNRPLSSEASEALGKF
jgi:hypothetical protein